MKVVCDKDTGKITVNLDNLDKCLTCINKTACPLLKALEQECVVLRYEEIDVKECDMNKK